MIVENDILLNKNKRSLIRDKTIKNRKEGKPKEENEDELDFKVKTEEEVIKVPKCTYANDVKAQTIFYFCQCSSEDFYPICEACALKCHRDHNPALRLDGVYACMCGKGNHVITRDNERRLKEKKMKMQNQCFFSRFSEITPNRGFFVHEGNVFCAVCVQYCLEKKHDDKSLEICEESNLSCSCEKHYEMNVINLNVDLISKPKFHTNLQNFNFNILAKIQFSKQMYIDYFSSKITDYQNAPSHENSKNFFVNFINFKILELFSAFAERWENKYFHVKNFLTNIPNDILFRLMSMDEPVSMLTSNDAPDFATAKFYFAEYVFNFIVRTYQLKFNNLWNIRTIINMNLYQRFLYLQEIRNFFKFNFDNDSLVSYETIFYDMSLTILELYENVLKINENFEFTDRIISYIFPTFNRIFKYLIKYNIVNDELKVKYFELVLDTINLSAEIQDCDYKRSSFYIIKSILYCLIYRNDRICINYIKNEKDPKNKKFVFMNNPESENICKIFISVVSKFNRTEDLNRTIIYDFYVRKIFELMIGKNEFYIKSLQNLLSPHVPTYQIQLLSASEITLEMRQFIYFPFLKELIKFTTKLNSANREYFDYNINYEVYQAQVNEVFKELKFFVSQELNFLPDTSKRYHIFCDKIALDDVTNEKIAEIQKCVKYTLFFQKVDEFFHIYADGKTYGNVGGKNLLSGVQLDYLKMILQVLFMIVNKNYENLCLLMNFKPTCFVKSLIDVPEQLFDFLDCIGEIIFSNQKLYEFDNFYFFTECINEILARVEFSKTDTAKNVKNLSIVERVMRLAKKSISHISMTCPDPLNCVESIMDVLRFIKSDQNLNQLLVEYFFNGEVLEVIREKENDPLTVIERFISSYFSFCNELIQNNLYFYGLLRDTDFLFDIDTVEFIVNEIYNEKQNKNVNIPVEIENQLTRFYVLASFPFNLKLTEIQKPLENMFMKNIPKNIKNISLYHLSKSNSEKTENEILVSRADFLLKILKKFEFRFQKISKHFIRQENLLDRKIFLLNFLEHCITRPIFLLFNQFLLYSNNLKGTECYSLYELTFYYLKALVYFYENVDKYEELNLHDDEGGFKANSKNESAKLEESKKLLRKVEILDYEEICMRSELDLNIAQEIFQDSLKISCNEVKYFDIEAIYGLFIKNIEKVLKISKEDKEDEKVATGKLSGFAAVYSTIKTKTTKVKKSKEMIRLERLVEKYKEKVASTYDDNLAMIKVLESSESEAETEIGVELYQYILTKFADNLTDYNFNTLQNQESYIVGEISKLDINNFKFQNIYILIYLNALFYHDSQKFQKILEENIGDNYETFFNFLSTNLVLPSVLCEITKVYELDNLKIETMGMGIRKEKKSLSFEISAIVIKFLQNMCESHNQVFQNRFFNHVYNIEAKEYKFKEKSNLLAESPDTKFNTNKLSFKRNTVGFNTGESRKDLNSSILSDSEEVLNTMGSVDRPGERQARKTRVIAKPISADFEKGAGQRELYEKKKQKEREEAAYLEKKKLSFFNFVCHNMRILITHLHVDCEFNSSLLTKIREFKNFDNILEIYQRFADLVIEMLQGSSNKNFDNFYKRLPASLDIFDEAGQIANPNTLDSFIFIQKSMEIKTLLFDAKNPFDNISLPMKFNLFVTINNLISQELNDISLVKIFLTIFPPDKIMDVVSKYVRGIYIKHIYNCDYESEEFNNWFEDLELNNETYLELIRRFKTDSEIYDDEYFKLASQMYLYLTVLGESYSIPEAERILKLDKKEIIIVPEDPDPSQAANGTCAKIWGYLKNIIKKSKFMGINIEENDRRRKKKKIKHHINNLIISSKFLNKIIHSCEFMIDSSNDEADELKLKIIYFIIDPRVYLISKNNIETFFDEVDRSSSTTKLKSLIDKLNFFVSEVDYKYTNLKKSRYLKWMLEVDYKNVDFLNFCISLMINFILLIFLKGDALEKGLVYYTTVSLAGVQIFINVIYLIIFLISKHKFYVLVEKNNYEKGSIGIIDHLKIQFFDTFLFNDEIYLMILNIIIGSLGILSSYATFLFSLQLLTVIKFVPTIKEIVIAFKLRFAQLISMIGFLAILIYFYSNIGFYFLSDEFEKELDNGQKENLCATLLGCSITYFNLGVRAGGGIGDLLDMKPFRDTTSYWVRWITDMVFYITVILLLLNMINGVIVSTFSQIREESNEKEEDIKNKCFVCNIDRVEFEKRKIAFADHLKHEHNTKTYIRFLIYLKLASEKDLDADQSFIISCIKNREITCFPVMRASSVGNVEQNDEEGEDED